MVNTKQIITEVVLVIIFSFAIAMIVSAQEPEKYDSVKATANYSNLRADSISLFDIPVPITEGHAVTLNADYKVFSFKTFRLGAIAEYSTNFNGSRFHQYSAGGILSIKLFDQKLEPFTRLLYGIHRTEDAENHFLKSLGLGVDVNVTNHFFIRPIEFNKQFINDFPVNVNKLSSGIGVRF